MPLFNDAINLAYPDHPGFASGRYYSSSIYASTLSSTVFFGSVYYTYFFVPFQQTFSRVGFVTAVTHSSPEFVRIGIYKIASGLPASLILDLGEISLTTAGFKEILTSLTLSPGWYAIAVSCSPANTAIHAPNTNLTNLIGALNPSLASNTGIRATLAYGAFPSTANLTNLIDSNSPIIWMKPA